MKYIIIENKISREVSHIKVDEDDFDMAISIANKLRNSDKERFLGTTDNIDWVYDRSVDLTNFFAPSKFFQIFGSPARGRSKIELNGKKFAVDAVTQSLSEDEFNFLMNFWKKYEGDGKKSYLKVINDPDLYNAITILDILV